MEIAQRSLEFLALLLSGWLKQRTHEIYEITMRERLLEEVNRAEPCRLLAVLGQGVDKIVIALVTVQWAYYART
ncbi:MAG: hypothetical protein ABR589_02235, partial [Chthoniobacterales bacterium]